MGIIQEELEAISELLRCVKPAEAEGRMHQLIKQFNLKDLQDAVGPVRAVINAFFPKRQKALIAALEERLSSVTAQKGPDTSPAFIVADKLAASPSHAVHPYKPGVPQPPISSPVRLEVPSSEVSLLH